MFFYLKWYEQFLVKYNKYKIKTIIVKYLLKSCLKKKLNAF